MALCRLPASNELQQIIAWTQKWHADESATLIDPPTDASMHVRQRERWQYAMLTCHLQVCLYDMRCRHGLACTRDLPCAGMHALGFSMHELL